MSETTTIDLTIIIIDSLAGLPKDAKPWSPANGHWYKRVDLLGCVHWWREV